jgi:hypothetical protein
VHDTSERGIYLAGLSIPIGILVAGWKIALTVLSPSWFLAANALFTLGAVVAKQHVVRAHFLTRTAPDPDGTLRPHPGRRRAYRTTGAMVSLLALLYVASCVPLVVDPGEQERFSEIVAISIAVVAFTELAMAIRGVVAARRSKDLAVEAIRMVNLAGAMVLIVLTQTALTSLDGGIGTSVYNGAAGILFGTIAALIGVSMLTRRIDQVRTPAEQGTDAERVSSPPAPPASTP